MCLDKIIVIDKIISSRLSVPVLMLAHSSRLLD